MALATAPSTAAPSALPRERENMLVPVTTPRRSQPTTDCTATTTGLDRKPRPTPTTKHAPADLPHRVVGPGACTAAAPSRTNAAPIRAVSRKPIRV